MGQVNLKEQGQLIRQDEFTVFFRKKKCVRRVFLFEELILFSKTKKNDVGNDVYVYKQSFKVRRRSLFELRGSRRVSQQLNAPLALAAPLRSSRSRPATSA